MPSTSRTFASLAVQGVPTWVATVFLLFCGPAATVYAQAQKPPDAGYVYPPVVRVGEATDVRLGGYDWTDDLEWFVHRDDVRLEILGPPGDYLLTPPPYWTGPRASTPPQPIPRSLRPHPRRRPCAARPRPLAGRQCQRRIVDRDALCE